MTSIGRAGSGIIPPMKSLRAPAAVVLKLASGAIAAVLLSACGRAKIGDAMGMGGAGAGVPVTAIYAVPPTLDGLSQETFFDQPWPNDLRVENGSPRLTGFYN